MKKVLLGITGILLSLTVFGQQLPNPSFEDWSGATFDGNIQPASWHASNVEQVGFKFNFAHREAGHTGSYSMMVQDQSVGAAGITETSPGYFALGQPWVYLESVLKVNEATAGTAGGVDWSYRPDSMIVWIKRTGSDALKEDFYLLYYAWSGQARGDKYTGKNGKCTSVTKYDEESDVRQALNGNACGTTTPANQIAEGMWRERKVYSTWTRMSVPIFYMSDDVPTRMNIIFSASNYPNFRANSGLYEGNSLYVDDVSLIYSNKIQSLYIGNKLWAGFDPNSEEEQVYSLGRNATTIPSIVAKRGEGSLTNARGTTVKFNGRTLSGSEIQIVNGQIDGAPTTITVTPGDGGVARVYKIKFVREASENTKLAGISVNDAAISSFKPATYSYDVALPYGTTAAPVISVTKQEDEQEVVINQATSVTGSATIVVTAANKTNTQTYTLNFSVAQLADNTLKDIEVCVKENASDPDEYASVPGFLPSQYSYRVSVPMGTTIMPLVRAVSNYPAGAQTIAYEAPTKIDGGVYKISVTTPGDPIAKIYKVTFKAEKSSYSKLKELHVGDGSVEWIENFDPEQLIYYINLPLGTAALPEITYVKGDKYQEVSVESGGLDGTTRVVVTAASGAQTVYKLIVSTEKSDRSDLSMIYLDGVAVDGFSADKLEYPISLNPGTTSLPAITWDLGDPLGLATVKVFPNGLNGTTRISVTAQDGSVTTYELKFKLTQSEISTLSMIYLDGKPLEGFDPNTLVYSIELEKGTSALPVITFDKGDEFQSVTPRQGTNNEYRLVVRPQSGASQTYVLQFQIDLSENNYLKSINVGGVPLAGFDSLVQNYIDSLPVGVSQVPAVSAVAADVNARVASPVLNKYVMTITVTAENGDKRDYTITFVPRLSANAKLDMIYVGDEQLPNFSSNEQNYVYTLTTPTCPEVSVTRSDSAQQVTIAAPYADGTARILVTPEQGASMEYVIVFVKAPDASVLLNDIKVDGNNLSEAGFSTPTFSPDVFVYDCDYSGDILPKVEAVKSENQSVQQLTNNDTTRLYVSTSSATQVYAVIFHRQVSNNTALEGIYADGILIDGYSESVNDYAKTLPAGSSYPEVTYRKKVGQQVVVNKEGQNKYTLLVTAANGDTRTYNVSYSVERSDTTSVSDIELSGKTLNYDGSTKEYVLPLADDEVMPNIDVTTKDGQIVVVAPATSTQQQVHVLAESGDTATYRIKYTRETHADNCYLRDIIVNGRSLAGFDQHIYEYPYTLPRRTKCIPSIHPVGQQDDQTITTYLGGVDEPTIIDVESADGHTQRYTINFSVQKSSNSSLGSLVINGESRDVKELNYMFELPFGTTTPYDILYSKAEPEQKIEYISAPVNGESKIIVTAENGVQKTYSIRYTFAQSTGTNIIPSVEYTYVDAANTSHVKTLVPTPGNDTIDLPYGTKSFEISSVTKNYSEQSYVLNNGGVRRGATIIAVSNHEGVADVHYRFIPRMPEFDTTGKLKELKFNGVLVPNFRPDVYNYIVKVSNQQPAAGNFYAEDYNGNSVAGTNLDATKKQILFKVPSGETYSVCWYYTKYDNLLDFSGDWVTVEKGVGYKPSSLWKVPADCDDGYTWKIGTLVNLTYTTGKEVTPGGTNGVMLSTLRGAPMNGSVPGMMTLGTMSVSLTSNGNSTSSVGKGATIGTEYKNTPQALEFLVKPLSTSNITNWKMWLAISDGSNMTETPYTGDFSNLNKWQTVTVPITLPTNAVSKFNVMLSSCDQENAKQFGGGTIYESSVMYDNIHFVYNSELDAVYLDGTTNAHKMTKSGNKFTKTVSDDYIGVPSLHFTGNVHDQMQVVEWLNNGEWINGVLTGKVTNYGENAEDKTEYTIELKRNAVTDLDVTVTPEISIREESSNDTTFYYVPFGTKAMPNLNIIRNSIHQNVVVEKNGWTTRVTVTNEEGNSATMYYTFRESKSKNVNLADVYFDGDSYADFDADIRTYILDIDTLPLITFDKSTVGQMVHVDGSRVHVTAENGDTASYWFIPKNKVTKGQLAYIKLNGTLLAGFESEKYNDYTAVHQQIIDYARTNEEDSIVYIQRPTELEWQVYGTENHIYKIDYVLSSNNKLGAILFQGDTIDNFDPITSSYEITTNDLSVLLDILPAEPTQKLVIKVTSDSLVTINVIPECNIASSAPALRNGIRRAPNAVSDGLYTIKIHHQTSTNANLDAILLDSEMLPGFKADSLTYIYTIPVGAYKSQEPVVPSITYHTADPRASVETDFATELGQTTKLYVTAEDGITKKTYDLVVLSEASHCSELTGIVVNGMPVSDFEPGRHYYAEVSQTEDIQVGWTSDDKFQAVELTSDTVRIRGSITRIDYTITVTAQDGIGKQVYQVKVNMQGQSNDATLSNILLDGKDFRVFKQDIKENVGLEFSPMNNSYTIYLPPHTTILPNVSARLMMDGQTVEVIADSMEIRVKVTAVDGETQNTYVLKFISPQSNDATLTNITIHGDSIHKVIGEPFKPNTVFYYVKLPEGVEEYPEVWGNNKDFGVTVDTVWEQPKVTIHVTAEDGVTKSTYTLFFEIVPNGKDTVDMIYTNDGELPGFNPHKYFYSLKLDVGTSDYPDLWTSEDWYNPIESPERWPRVWMDTLDMAVDSLKRDNKKVANNLVRQIHVLAQNGKSNVYTISYEIKKSDVDTLQTITINESVIGTFCGDTTHYSVELPAGTKDRPRVVGLPGDQYQTVSPVQWVKTADKHSLGEDAQIIVTSESGKSKVYTISFPLALSNDSNLSRIVLDGKDLREFEEGTYTYTETLVNDSIVPMVAVYTKEEGQSYRMYYGDSVVNGTIVGKVVTIRVVAEDGINTSTYTIFFRHEAEDVEDVNTYLRMIYLDGEPLEDYNFETNTYTIELPVGTKTLPVVTVDKWYDEQTYTIEALASPYAGIDSIVNIVVRAIETDAAGTETEISNEDDPYRLLFKFTMSDDATLSALAVGGNQVDDFDPQETDYTIVHPFGKTEEDFFHKEDVTCTVNYVAATYVIGEDETTGTLSVTVTAENGEQNTYTIRQKITKGSNAKLAMIYTRNATDPNKLDSIYDFDSDIYVYDYIKQRGLNTNPEIIAVAEDTLAEVNYMYFNKTDTTVAYCLIIVTAADGETELEYIVNFPNTSVVDAQKPQKNDCLVKAMGNGMIKVATIRRDVSFFLYDSHGVLHEYKVLEPADPNDAIWDYSNGNEFLYDVRGNSGIEIQLIPGRVYIYGFYETEKIVISGGKLMTL